MPPIIINMSLSILSTSLLLASTVAGLTPGNTSDIHPKLETYRCTVADGCTRQTNFIVADSSQHNITQANGFSCLTGNNPPNTTACPTAEACAENCVIDGITDYAAMGVVARGTDLHMHILHNGTEVSPRIYLLEESKERYEMFKLTGNEFTFDVDMAKLPCGMNGALYLTEMPADGGRKASVVNGKMLNKAGPPSGTGYCDAQCFKTSFINGVGNIDNKGSCCNELDIWEANSRATQTAPHPCNETGLYLCTGDECDKSVCDKDGCTWNPNKLNATNYLGRGSSFKIDTTRKFTVVTQFPSRNGKLTQIRRFYIQDGKVVENDVADVEGVPAIDYMDNEYCKATNATDFEALGAMTGIGEAMSRGMVLAFSIWWDKTGFMSWLDTNNAGPCNATEGEPSEVLKVEANPEVKFSNIRFGEINSTVNMRA